LKNHALFKKSRIVLYLRCTKLFFVLKQSFVLFLLLALLLKTIEPIFMAAHYTNAEDAPLAKIMDEPTIELKIYAPLPYSAAWEDKDPVQETFQKNNTFYTIVERRFEKDTFYVKVQQNCMARDRFDALSTALNSAIAHKDAHKTPSPKKTIALDDLIKVFSPPVIPALVIGDNNYVLPKTPCIWQFLCDFPTTYSPVFAPPPEWA
jgi:hypothetical protein